MITSPANQPADGFSVFNHGDGIESEHSGEIEEFIHSCISGLHFGKET
jgi:hypothetical protein